MTDAAYPYDKCSCGQRKPREEVSCGNCPCRRASDEEQYAASEQGITLPECGNDKCRKAIIHSKREGYSPRYTHLGQSPRCYECFKDQNGKKEACTHPKHPPYRDRYVVSEAINSYMVIITPARKSPRPEKRRVCDYCAFKHKLETWDNYSYRMGKVVPSTGEVLPLTQTPLEFSLKGHPLDRWGGMAKAWCPKRGIDGTKRLVNGTYQDNYVIFSPKRYEHFTIGSKQHRVIVGVILKRDSSDPIDVSDGTVWHPSVNAWIDTFFPEDDRKRTLTGLGFLYVRLTGVNPGAESHTFVKSRLIDYQAKVYGTTHEKPTFAEWLAWCAELK